MSDPKVIGASVSPDGRTLTVIYDESVGDLYDNGLTVLPGPDHLAALRSRIILTVVICVAIALAAVAVTVAITGTDTVQWVLPAVATIAAAIGLVLMLRTRRA